MEAAITMSMTALPLYTNGEKLDTTWPTGLDGNTLWELCALH
jgi:hypothetical protein